MNKGAHGTLKIGIIIAIFMLAIPILAGAEQLVVSARRVSHFSGAKAGYWGVRLQFNLQVFPSNLAESIRVKAGGKQVNCTIMVPSGTREASHPGRRFLVVPVKASREPQSMTVTVVKGLSDVTGRLLLAKDFTYQFVSMEKIIVSDISTFYRSRVNKGLTLRVTDRISQRDLASAVEITPHVPNLKVERISGWRFRITGDFEFDRDYVLHIEEKAVDNGRGILATRELSFKGPGLKSTVEPNTERSVVELLGRQLYPLTVTNTTKIQCRLTRVPPVLLPDVTARLKEKKSVKQGYWAMHAPLLKGLSQGGTITPRFFAEPYEQAEVFFAPEAKGHVFGYSLPLSFRTNPKRGGAWLLTLVDVDTGYSHQVQDPVQITDLSISYKYSAGSLLLWVTSIYTGQPVDNVEVLLFQADGTCYVAGKTDMRGLLMIKDGTKFPAISLKGQGKERSLQPVVLSGLTKVVAATEDDSCGIELEMLRLKPFAVTQSKSIKDNPDVMRGYVFTERGVYRPGETVHFKAVSREFEHRKIVSPVGEVMKVVIKGPRGDIHYTKDLTLGTFGSCYDSFPTKKYFPVGTYTIQVKPERQSDSRPSFTQTFMLQDFKRARHYATVRVKRMTRDSDAFVGLQLKEDFLGVEVTGQYYTGGPVKHGRVRWKATLVSVEHKVGGLDGYFFGNEDETTRFLESGESTLDRNGKLQLTIPLDPKLLTGIYGVRISATVLDIDGEPATEVQTYSPKAQLSHRDLAPPQTGADRLLQPPFSHRSGSERKEGLLRDGPGRDHETDEFLHS